MFKVKITYYEGEAKRDMAIKLAKARGENAYRPYSVQSEAEYPIVPRPGDHIVFPLDERLAKPYRGVERRDDGFYYSAVVQWVELNHGSEALYVVCTDVGHKGRGEYDGGYETELRKMEHELRELEEDLSF